MIPISVTLLPGLSYVQGHVMFRVGLGSCQVTFSVSLG